MKTSSVGPSVSEDKVLVTLYEAIVDLADHDQAWQSKIRGALRARDWRTVHDLAASSPFVVQGTVWGFQVHTQLVALTRKFPFSKESFPEIDREAAAMKKFWRAEVKMKRVNIRFRALTAVVHYQKKRKLPDVYYRMLPKLERARRYIQWVLGETPNLESIYAKCDWSAGASIGVHGNATNWGRKALSDVWTCTPGALPYFRSAVLRNHHLFDLLCEKREGISCWDPLWVSAAIDGRVRLVDNNKICCVPKDFNCDRTIAVEPTVNNFLQKGVDLEMRELLLRIGIDLTNQLRNQTLARTGSLIGDYATLDLSSASDTLSWWLCRYLLPVQWFDLLNRLRSPGFDVDGVSHRYEKFVSMGNGFCFPLETLVFAALAHACHVDDKERAVYGDDIIVPQTAALELAELLRFAGFSLNTSKSYFFGPFRESCGADWYQGQDVRPVYVRSRVGDLLSIMTLHNSLRRSEWVDTLFETARRRLREMIPRNWRYVHCGKRLGTQLTGAFDVDFDEVLSSPLTTHLRDLTGRFSGPVLMSRGLRDYGEGSAPSMWQTCEYIAVLRGSSSEQPLTLRQITQQRRYRRLVA